MEGLMWDIEDNTEQKENPESLKQNHEMDDLWVFLAPGRNTHANDDLKISS